VGCPERKSRRCCRSLLSLVAIAQSSCSSRPTPSPKQWRCCAIQYNTIVRSEPPLRKAISTHGSQPSSVAISTVKNQRELDPWTLCGEAEISSQAGEELGPSTPPCPSTEDPGRPERRDKWSMLLHRAIWPADPTFAGSPHSPFAQSALCATAKLLGPAGVILILLHVLSNLLPSLVHVARYHIPHTGRQPRSA